MTFLEKLDFLISRGRKWTEQRIYLKNGNSYVTKIDIELLNKECKNYYDFKLLCSKSPFRAKKFSQSEIEWYSGRPILMKSLKDLGLNFYEITAKCSYPYIVFWSLKLIRSLIVAWHRYLDLAAPRE